MLIDNISRGGLKFPQPAVIHAVLCAKVVFNCVTSKENEPLFHAGTSQRATLLSPLMYLLSDSKEFDACEIGHSRFHNENVLLQAINILLKNYAALRNELNKKKSNGMKRKLLTVKL